MIEFNIQPRATGKTTKIVNLFITELVHADNHLKQPPILLVANQCLRDRILYDIRAAGQLDIHALAKQHIYSLHDRAWVDKGFNPAKSTVFIDEYLMFSQVEKRRLFHRLRRGKRNIIIYTTSNILYNRELVRNIKLLKQMDPGFIARIGITRETLLKDLEFDQYYFNFITEPDAIIVSDGENHSLPEEKYATEILGRLFAQ